MNTINVIKSIEKSKGVEVALVTTFTVDLGFAEKIVINRIFDTGCKYLSIFADGTQFYNHIKTQPDIDSLGTKYVIHSIKTNAAFHPKMILLLGPKNAKLIIGSGNLTTSGLVGNYEYFSEFEYSADNIEYLNIIQTAYRTFLDLYEIAGFEFADLVAIDNELRNKLQTYDYLNQKPADETENILINNLREPLINQLLDRIEGRITRVDICVPFFDQSLDMVEMIATSTDCENISIYIQDGTSNYPKGRLQHSRRRFEKSLQIFSTIQTPENKLFSIKRYHGKVYRFQTEQNDYILYGSPNCSTVALARSFNEGGNFESALLGIGMFGQFSSYFDDLQLTGDYSNLNVVEQQDGDFEACPVILLYTSALPDLTTCILSVESGIIINSASINGSFGEITHDGHNTVVRFDSLKVGFSSPIYTLHVDTSIGQFDLTGWAAYPNRLIEYRMLESRHAIGKINSLMDLENSQTVLDILEQCLKDMDFVAKPSRFAGSDSGYSVGIEEKAEMAGPNANVDDYFISDEQAKASHTALSIMKEAHPFSYFASLFFANLSADIRINFDQASNSNNETKSEENIQTSTKTNIETYMQRFIDRYLGAIKSDEYLQQIDTQKFLDYMVIFLKLIWLMFDSKLLKDTITIKYVAKLYMKLANALTKKVKIKNLDHEKFNFVISVLLEATIFSTALVEQEDDVDAQNEIRKAIKWFVSFLDYAGIDFRDNYLEYFELVNFTVSKIWPDSSFTVNKFEGILEPLFGYKTWNQIQSFLEKKYGCSVVLKFDTSEATFTIWTTEPTFKHNLEEYKLALQIMDRTSEKAVNFIYKYSASKVFDKMKVKVTGKYSKSLISKWKKNGEYKEDTMLSPLTTIY